MKEKGFSLVDLITAFSILSILLCISLPAFKNLSSKYTLTSAVREISASLNYAKYKSIFQRAKFRVSFAERGYRIERFNTASKKWERDKWAICKNVIIYANNSPIFHPNGTVSNLTSIYISNSSGKYKITIAISGRIKAVKLDKD